MLDLAAGKTKQKLHDRRVRLKDQKYRLAEHFKIVVII